ncbi:MAG: protein-L-isoaspartate O-methyltransferase family protein [Devosia sp.]|jgi:protein-L-isoaspartate(D-aspartate) O-methyltransferase
MLRRSFLLSSGATLAATAIPSLARANVPVPYDWAATPPVDTRQNFIDWMVKTRGEDPKFLGERYDRYQWMLSVNDVFGDNNKRAVLMVPREEFCLPINRSHAYDIDFLDIGFGVTISGPGLVARMTSTLGIVKGDKVLEIGTGSGYQSAVLSNLTDQVWTIEIIKPLAERTRGIYDGLIGRGYTEYKAITTKQADGYYGWPEAGPFDKIIVTCGIDHIPPPLLEQLKPNGIMVVPIGPPGAQHVLKVIKAVADDGTVTVKRSDIYNGKVIPFVPFTALQGDTIKGTHNG